MTDTHTTGTQSSDAPLLDHPPEVDTYLFPASFAQQRLWFLDKLEPGNSTYNVPFAVRITGRLRIEILEGSFKELIRRHEILRTTFSTDEDGNVVQVVSLEPWFEMGVVDLSNGQASSFELEAQQHAIKMAREPFDLEKGPLLRTCILKLGPEEHILSVTLHHSIADGWSWGILLRELSHFYRELNEGTTPSLPELKIQYGDYATWQRDWLKGDNQARLLSYWKQQLERAPALLEMPTNFQRTPRATNGGRTESLVLQKSFLTELRKLAQAEGCTLFMMLLAAYDVILLRYTGQEDIVVGSPVAGRYLSDTEALIGLFVNSVPLRTRLTPATTFRELLVQVRETALGAYAHQELPFEKLVAELQPERSLSHSPIFQTMFVLQNVPRSSLDIAGLSFTPIEVTSGTAKMDTILTAIQREDGLRLRLSYNSDLFRDTFIRTMLEHFKALLKSAVANPDQSIGKLEMPRRRGGE